MRNMQEFLHGHGPGSSWGKKSSQLLCLEVTLFMSTFHAGLRGDEVLVLVQGPDFMAGRLDLLICREYPHCVEQDPFQTDRWVDVI